MEKRDDSHEYLILGNMANGGSSLVWPRVLRVRLEAASVDMLQRAEKVYKFAQANYGGDLIRRMELEFPVACAEYLVDRPTALRPAERWNGRHDSIRISVDRDGINFMAEERAPYGHGPGDTASFFSDTLEYARLEEAIRNWRAHQMGQSIDDAMAADGPPAAATKPGGMSPL